MPLWEDLAALTAYECAMTRFRSLLALDWIAENLLYTWLEKQHLA